MIVINRDLVPRRFLVTPAAISAAIAEFVDWFDAEAARLR
jgi:hypothetical protein